MSLKRKEQDAEENGEDEETHDDQAYAALFLLQGSMGKEPLQMSKELNTFVLQCYGFRRSKP